MGSCGWRRGNKELKEGLIVFYFFCNSTVLKVFAKWREGVKAKEICIQMWDFRALTAVFRLDCAATPRFTENIYDN